MQRALTSRATASVRSASKLRPIASSGFNAQQLRFAHKVSTYLSDISGMEVLDGGERSGFANKDGIIGAQVRC